MSNDIIISGRRFSQSYFSIQSAGQGSGISLQMPGLNIT